ncbi:MAG: RidA family protein [Proteobacteria bacterium]|nr:RidA family protein [Pseudomonadota bacterium]
MTVERLDKGTRMSQVVIHGDTIYLAGQVGTPGASITEQTQNICDKIDALLARSGSSKSNMLQAIIWLSDMSYFAEMNAVWDAWIDPDNPPARACGEAKLATPDYHVEIIITAAK